MIKERQEQLESLYAETFGGSGETEAVSDPVSDLVLDPDAYPPKDKFERLLKNDGFLETWKNRGNLPSLSEHDMSLANFAANDGWSDQEIANLMIAFRRKHGQTKEDRGKALRLDYIRRTLAKVRHRGKDKKRLTVATQLLALAEDIELFHTPDRVPYAVIKQDGHTETWPLESRTFKDYLARRFYEQTGSAPSSQAVQNALNVLRGQALFAGPEEPVYTRLAGHGGKIYIDLCNSDWSVVEITVEGWWVIQNPPIHFVRSRGMTALPAPQKGGEVNDK